MKVKVYNQEGAEVGTTKLNPEVFGVEPNEALVHQYVVNFLARQRQGNANTKTRRQVRGGGRKPYRQKGTGRARAGTTRSPLWRGGGTVFGPQTRLYGSEMPKKMKNKAICSVFSDRAKQDKIKILDKISLDEIKTKNMVNILSKFDLDNKKCLILDDDYNENCILSSRNLQKVLFTKAKLANGYDLLNADYVLITQSGLERINEVFG
jgi:large subunit ribosomal protein L4